MLCVRGYEIRMIASALNVAVAHPKRASPVRFDRLPVRQSGFVQHFLSHVRTTGHPESFPGLYLGLVDKAEPFQKIVPFQVDSRKREDGGRAPCQMCGHRNKYTNGWLVWLPRLHTVAAIGCDCADQQNLAEADRDYKARNDRDFQEKFIEDHLPLVPRWLETIADALVGARAAHDVYLKFRLEGDEFQQLLKRAVKESGRLLLTEALDSTVARIGPQGFSGAGGASTRDIPFGILAGRVALLTNYDPVKELATVERNIEPYAQYASDSGLLAFIDKLDPSNTTVRTECYEALKSAQKGYDKFRARLLEFQAFFGRENVRRIGEWASHPAQPQPFEARLVASTIVVFRNQSRHFRVRLPETFFIKPALLARPEER